MKLSYETRGFGLHLTCSVFDTYSALMLRVRSSDPIWVKIWSFLSDKKVEQGRFLGITVWVCQKKFVHGHPVRIWHIMNSWKLVMVVKMIKITISSQSFSYSFHREFLFTDWENGKQSLAFGLRSLKNSTISQYAIAKSQEWACKAQKTHLFDTEIDTTHPELILKDKPYIVRSIATWELHDQDSWVSVLIESLAKPANQIAWCLISGIFTGKIFAEPLKPKPPYHDSDSL